MKNQIKKDLTEVRKEYGEPRRTVIENIEEVVVKKEAIKEQLYYALVDRFHYIKLIDEATYQRNQDSILTDFRHCIPILNTDKMMVFTESGKRGSCKASAIPCTKYKEKGVPLDTLCGLDHEEEVLFMMPEKFIGDKILLFVHSSGLVKQVEGAEFIASKKLIDAYKLKDGTLTAVLLADKSEVILESEHGMVLRFKLEEIPLQKKTAAGVKGISLAEGDRLRNAYVADVSDEIFMQNQLVSVSRFKPAKRAGKGTKIRL